MKKSKLLFVQIASFVLVLLFSTAVIFTGRSEAATTVIWSTAITLNFSGDIRGQLNVESRGVYPKTNFQGSFYYAKDKCQVSLDFKIASDNTTATASKGTGEFISGAGTKYCDGSVQNSLIKQYSISNDRPSAEESWETEQQQSVFFTARIPLKPNDAPQYLVQIIYDSNNTETRVNTTKSVTTYNSYIGFKDVPEYRFSKNLPPGNYKICAEGYPLMCATFIKVKLTTGVVNYGYTYLDNVIDASVKVRGDRPCGGTLTLGTKEFVLTKPDGTTVKIKSEQKIITPTNTGGVALNCTFDTSLSVVFKDITPGKYKVCALDKCKEFTKDDRFATVELDATDSSIFGDINSNSSTSDNPDIISCEAEGISLSWILCPIISGVQNLVEKLNGAINNLMTLPTDKLFIVSDTNIDKAANQFYDAWSGFRYIAMGLLVIIALIMVLSQAIGVGPFDAYTIRKVLPRLLAAVVLVSLSWPLMKLAVEITNGVGHSVSGLIYGPFKDSLTTENPSLIVVGGALLGGIGAAFTFGIFGTLAFVATAALSMLSGMATLIFREMLIMFLVVVAPVAIICSILPNTQTVWKKWSDYFLRALIVFPIFSGVIAIGQVFAVIGPTLHDGVVGTLIQFVGYFGPYFMLPKIFAMSGGAVAAVGAVAQKATAGMRGGLSNYRKKKAGTRVTNAGARAKSGDFLSRRLDRFGGNRVNERVAGLAGGAKAGFGFGKKGEQATSIRRQLAKDAADKDAALQKLGHNDYANTIMATSGGTGIGAERASHRLMQNSLANNSRYRELQGQPANADRDAEMRSIEAEAETTRTNGLAAARTVGFSRANAQSALSTMAKNKSRAVGPIGAHELVQAGISALAGPAQEAIDMKNDFAFNSSAAGRGDLAASGDWTDEYGNPTAGRVLDGLSRSDLYATVHGHPNAINSATNESVEFANNNGYTAASAARHSVLASEPSRTPNEDMEMRELEHTANTNMERVLVYRAELDAMLPSATGDIAREIEASRIRLDGSSLRAFSEQLSAAPPVPEQFDVARATTGNPRYDPAYLASWSVADRQQGARLRPSTRGDAARSRARVYQARDPNNIEN